MILTRSFYHVFWTAKRRATPCSKAGWADSGCDGKRLIIRPFPPIRSLELEKLMVSITFLASLVLLHWIVRKEPGLGKSNGSTAAADCASGNEPTLSTLDLASLARSLARECPQDAAPEETPVNARSPQASDAASI